MKAMYGVDGGLKYDITKALSFSGNVRDIFNTRRFRSDIDINTPYFPCRTALATTASRKNARRKRTTTSRRTRTICLMKAAAAAPRKDLAEQAPHNQVQKPNDYTTP
jgi:hypothetical protein